MRRDRRLGRRPAELLHVTETKVRFSEVDSMRVVWHGEYVRYLEDGREAFGRKYEGLGYMDFCANGYTAPIVEMQLQYVSPLTVNDVAVVETRYVDTAAAKLCFEYLIRRGADGAIAARARTVQVFLDAQGNLELTPPEFLLEWKRRWMVGE